MELHQLRYFVAVADFQNFTRAAEHCLVAQPSLSQQIAKLEKSLGKQLFERGSRTITLTEAGECLYRRAASILASVEDASERIRILGESEGRVRIGAIPTVAPYLLPSVLRRFGRAHRKVQINVQEDLTARLIKACVDGEFDVGILALPVEDDSLHVETLFQEELYVALPANHKLTKKKRLTIEDVLKEPFVLLSETHCLGEHIVSFCRQKECPPIASCRSSQLLTIQEMVGMGYGLSLIPEMAKEADNSKKRVYRSLSGKKPMRTIVMMWNKNRYRSPLVEAFIRMLKACTS